MLEQNYKIKDIVDKTGLSRTTVHRIIKDIETRQS